MRRFFLFIICPLFVSSIAAQTTVSTFPLSDVKLLPSRFQRNMQRDSAWIASIPVQSLLHSFRNTAGVFSGKEGGYTTIYRARDDKQVSAYMADGDKLGRIWKDGLFRGVDPK